MAKFRVSYIKDGELRSAILKASSKDELEIKGLGEVCQIKRVWLDRFSPFGVNLNEFALAFWQLSLLLGAGVGLVDGLRSISAASKNRALKEFLDSLIADILTGTSPYVAWQRYGGFLGRGALAIVRMGESSGDMAGAMAELYKLLKQSHKNLSMIKKASAYPAFIALMLLCVFGFISLWVLPELGAIFKDFKQELPLATKLLLALSEFLKDYASLLGIFMALMLLAFIFAKNSSPRFRLALDTLIIKLYPFSKPVISLNLFTFSLVLSRLLKAGVPIIQASKEAALSTPNLALSKKLCRIPDLLLKGVKLEKAYASAELLAPALIGLLQTASKSGKLNEAALMMSEYYASSAKNELRVLNASLEPILLLMVGAMVLFLALGVMLPIWQLKPI